MLEDGLARPSITLSWEVFECVFFEGLTRILDVLKKLSIEVNEEFVLVEG